MELTEFLIVSDKFWTIKCVWLQCWRDRQTKSSVGLVNNKQRWVLRYASHMFSSNPKSKVKLKENVKVLQSRLICLLFYYINRRHVLLLYNNYNKNLKKPSIKSRTNQPKKSRNWFSNNKKIKKNCSNK